MILSKVYEDAERRLKRNEITLGEFEQLVDIEVIEPKRGEWKHRIFDWVCSECGYRVKTDIVDYNFCPNCGARMKGVGNGRFNKAE